MKTRIKQILKKALNIESSISNSDRLGLYEHIPDKMDVFFDIGAHTGTFTKELIKNVKVEKVYLFEPIPELYETMIADSELKKCRCYKIALSAEKGKSDFYIYENMQTSSLLSFDNSINATNNINKNTKRKVTVETDTLSNFVKKENIKSIDLLKIDAQGADLEVLRGGDDFLNKVKAIYIEVSFKKIYSNSSTFFDVYDYLNKRDFILVDLYPVYKGLNSELLQSDAVFINIKSLK